MDLPDLEAFSQPEGNNAQSVSNAFASVLGANHQESSEAAYHQLLYALGNNHAGTYYSVALAVLPAIGRILHDGSTWPQRTVIEVVIDLCISFQPAPGHELYLGAPLASLIAQKVWSFVPLLESIGRGDDVEAQSARELLSVLPQIHLGKPT